MEKSYCLLILLIVFISSGITLAESRGVNTNAKLKGKKIVMIIANRMFEEVEYKYPREIFDREGADVTVASSSLNMATGGSLRVQPDILLEDVNVSDFDAVVYIGGMGVGQYFNDYQAHRIAKQAVAQDKILGAICMSPHILVNAGVLKGKRATAFETEGMEGKGIIVVKDFVVRDGNIITANGPGAAKQYGEAIVAALCER
jgi:protease I